MFKGVLSQSVLELHEGKKEGNIKEKKRKENRVGALNQTPERLSLMVKYNEGANQKSSGSDPHEESHSTRANENSLALYSVEDANKE